jgi:flagellar motor switch protein FliN/FliY
MNEWITRLTALLREITGGELNIENTGSHREPDPAASMLWWKCSSGQPALTIWLGMEESAAASLLKRTNGADAPVVELKAEYSKLLGRLDEKGEVADQGPAGQVIDAFEIRCDGLDPLLVYVATASADKWSNLEVLKDIELPVTLRFGTTRMTLQDLTGLNTGSVIEFDGGLHDPVEVLVNGRVIARGEAVIVQDSYGVRISEIASPGDRIAIQREMAGSTLP